jgi:hypothetical protein
MARIRTIKPELPQSESMGRVSREARLCFILLWTLADDAGRLRGNGRMLASLLFPYDDDAKKLIEKWLDELHTERCITRYEVEGDKYIQINQWLVHQKIDKPSPSKIPPYQLAPIEGSRGFAKARDDSAADQGVDQGEEGNLVPTVLVGGTAPDPYRVPPCDYEAIAQGYAELLPQLPQIAVMSETRKGHVNARWRELCAAEKFTQAQAVEWFRDFFAHVARSRFLTGSGPPRRDQTVWRADFDWLMAPTNFVKVVEGRYETRKTA